MKNKKPFVREVILVEGKYDKNTLSQIVDAAIVTTDGFSVFQDREKLAFFRRLAAQRGLIVLTDSDGAGFLIRNFLKGAIPKEQLKQAYVPDVYGKERRKRRPGKEAGATMDGAAAVPCRTITKQDLYALGLSGRPNSAERRKKLLLRLDLPEHLSANAMLDALNLLVERDAKITNFKKDKYHIVHIGVGDADAVSSLVSYAA